MVTAAQIKQIAAPFMEHHPDFIWINGHRLIQTPFSNQILGFCFERSFDADAFRLRYFVFPLHFWPETDVHLSFGKRLKAGAAGVSDLWSITSAEAAHRAPVVMEKTWKRLERIETTIDLYEYIQDQDLVGIGWSIHNPYVSGPMFAALGFWAQAITFMQIAVGHDKKGEPHQDSSPAIAKMRRDRAFLLNTLREDPSSVYDLLHRWEVETVRNLGLEEHWRPTGFIGEKALPQERH